MTDFRHFECLDIICEIVSDTQCEIIETQSLQCCCVLVLLPD